jgi:phosphoglycolate phosphatase-like HAD superfamily hydrolase
MKAGAQRLVLWDIDGTILHGGGLWSRCFMEAFRERFPQELRKIPFSGKTDRQICRDLMEACGQWREKLRPGESREHDAHIDFVIRGYLDRARAGVVTHAHQIRLLPGVRELIEELGRRAEVTMGLLTGNVREGAWLKLGTVGLRGHFGFKDDEADGFGGAFGAFGCDHWDRYELPRVAVERARLERGLEFSGKQVVIIGDTIHDVGCGQSIGARAIGVGTGQPEARERVHAAYRGEPLEPADPRADHFFEDLSGTQAVLAAILGER